MIGKTISHYKILEKLGGGGMGVVYKAEDTKLKRPVALKFLHPDLTQDPVAKKRFIQEAQAASALQHTNICTIHEINETKPAPGEPGDDQIYISMEYLDGKILKEKIKEKSLTVEETVHIAIQVARGLEKAHKKGIVHRDIKPANIIITDDGVVKIVDFGIAKLSTSTRLTKPDTILGTAAYMSPEQLLGEEIDHRTDIWSLGITFYEMLTGQLPFQGEYDQALLFSIVNEDPQLLQISRPELSQNLQIIIDRALVKKPENRYQAVREMIGDLEGLSDSTFTKAPSGIKREKSQKVSYLSDYRSDIYISYAHIDDKALTKGQNGWITNFHQALEVRLEQLLGSEINILRDDHVVSREAADIKHKMKYPHAAILVTIISPNYLKSQKCVQEVKEFSEAVEQNGGLQIEKKARIFKAVKTHVSSKSQPDELRVLSDYEFYQFDPSSGRPKEFWPELGAEANRNFWAKLEDIAYDIFQLMESIKAGKKDDSQVKSDQTIPTLYLAESTYDITNHHDRIKRQMQQRGYGVLPDRSLPLRIDDLQKQICSDLERCSVSIHMIGERYGVIPEGEKRSIAEIQYQLALNHDHNMNFSRLIWMPPGLQIQDERQTRFVDSLKMGTAMQTNTDLLQTPLEEFKIYLVDKVNVMMRDAGKKAIEDNIVRIYLQCDQRDLDATTLLEDYLYEQGFEVRLPAFEGDEMQVFEAHRDNLLLCDATIIFYGEASDSWLSTKMTDLLKVVGYGRLKPMQAKAVYVTAPENKMKQRFRTREALTIRSYQDFTPEVLAPFMDKMQNGGETGINA